MTLAVILTMADHNAFLPTPVTSIALVKVSIALGKSSKVRLIHAMTVTVTVIIMMHQ